MRLSPNTVLAGMCALLIGTPAHAQVNTFLAGTRYDAPPLTTFTTFGENMVGMRVSWSFSDGSFGTANWASFGPDAYGVNTADFRVSMGRFSDTFMDAWSVSNRSTTKTLTSVRFNGQPGRVVFDCGWTTSGCADLQDPQQLTGSENSARGWTLSTLGFGGDNIYAGGVLGIYANLVGVGGANPLGDLFEQLTIVYTDGMAPGFIHGFRADTDNTSADIPDPVTPGPGPGPVPVPEPTSTVLALFGAAALIAKRRLYRRGAGSSRVAQ